MSFLTSESSRPTQVRFRVLALLSLAAVMAYFCRNSLGVAESTIRGHLNFTKTQMGWVMSAFFWSYALFQVPAAHLGRQFGTRQVLSWSAVLWSFSMILTGIAHRLELLILAQILMGLAQAAVFPCAIQSVSVWIPKPSRATACSALAIGMQIGAILTASLTGVLIGLAIPQDFLRLSTWRLVFIGYSIPGIMLGLIVAARFRNLPVEHASLNQAERELLQSDDAKTENEKSMTTPWMAILTNRSILCLCGQQAFRAAGYAFFATWFPTFLQQTRSLEVKESGYLQGTVFAATMLGGLTGGFLVDRIYKRTQNLRLSRSGVGAICMFACGGLICAAYFAQSMTVAVLLLDAGAFLAAMAGPCAYVTSIDLGRDSVSAVFGLMNMCGNLAAAATPVVIGYLFKFSSNWNIVLALFSIAYLIATLCWLLVDSNQSLPTIETNSESSE